MADRGKQHKQSMNNHSVIDSVHVAGEKKSVFSFSVPL